LIDRPTGPRRATGTNHHGKSGRTGYSHYLSNNLTSTAATTSRTDLSCSTASRPTTTTTTANTGDFKLGGTSRDRPGGVRGVEHRNRKA
jgi:hypothetical protein